jgi:hypothetical protein
MQAKELKLSIVALRDVVLHEEIEHVRVEKIKQRLRSDHILKNPPIVTRVANGDTTRYIVLDGASRTTALRESNVPDILVQIVDYHSPKVKLESWHHLLLDITPARLRQELDTVSCVGMEEMNETRAKHELAARNILGYVKFSDGHLIGLRCSQKLTEHADALNQVVRSYESKVELYRVATTDFESHLADPKRLAAIMVFPKYKPDEIVQLALNGARVPMGITRHIIPGRALRINLPLDVLESAQTHAEKNAWLDAWLDEKMRNRNVRFYQEPVFLFDE